MKNIKAKCQFSKLYDLFLVLLQRKLYFFFWREPHADSNGQLEHWQ